MSGAGSGRGDRRNASGLERSWRAEARALAGRDLARRLRTVSPGSGPVVRVEGREAVNLASNDYLGLASDPRLVEALRRGAERHGVGAGAARLVTGHLSVHAELEEALADFLGTEAALVFTSGFATNVGLLPALAGPRDLVVADALVHASLVDGARLSRARFRRYRHGDVGHAEAFLEAGPRAGGHALLVTDGVFSMDGDFAPLPELADLAGRSGALLVVDDAHGLGVVGPGGRGSVARAGVEDRVPVRIGTLSKALGAQGGFVAGSRALVERLLHGARSWVYSTGLSPAVAAAARAALAIVREEPERRELRQAHVRFLREELGSLGFELSGDPDAPLLAVLAGEAGAAMELSRRLLEEGVLAPAIRPPTVPEGTSRIRLAPMATHTRAQMERTPEAFARAADALSAGPVRSGA